jgi:hypothetical protein
MGDVGVVVGWGLKTSHICATEPDAHFLVALTTERVFGLLQMLSIPVAEGIEMSFVPLGQRDVREAMSFFVEDCSHTVISVGVVAGESFLLPDRHLFLARAVTNPDLVFLQTTGGEIPVAGVGWEKKERPRAIAMAPRKIRWRVHPEESAKVRVATPRI